jgi:hypothetical protein
MLSELLTHAGPLQFDCPTCGATEQTGPECRRCRSDLRLLERIEQTRAAELKALAAALNDCRWHDALASAELVHHLRRDPASFRLVAACQLLNHQVDAAWETRRQSRGG